MLLTPIVACARVPPQNWTQNFIPSLKDWQAALLYKGMPLSVQLDQIAVQINDVAAQITGINSDIGTKVDVKNGTSANQSLTTPTLTSPVISGGASTEQILNAPTISAGTSTGQALTQPTITQAPSVDIAGNQSLTVSPVGNPISTLSSLNAQGTATSSTGREFLVNLGFTSSVAGSATGADKVVLYAGMTCNQGSGNCWAMNPLATAGTGYTGSVQTVEADLNNFASDAPVGGTFFRSALSANGAVTSGYLNTSGLFVGSVNSVPIFHAGVLFTNNAVKDAAIWDQASSANYGYYNQSSHASALINDTGASPVLINAQGTYSYSIFDTQNATANYLLTAKAGQLVCFDGTAMCVSSSSGKLTVQSGGANLFSIDSSGNVVIKGTLTQSGSP
ncbi:hypothetical protein AA16373_2628 [Komagataeibacter swingsii DSM 16373]|nr:hypothetical protein AA16373_2628 [Komagataeibacter swingsii DSM 16373]